jgi:hypothetical protein
MHASDNTETVEGSVELHGLEPPTNCISCVQE